MKPDGTVGLTWILRMAWRDSRSSRPRLLLYLSTIVLGVAALVAITSFGHNLLEAVEDQSKALLGADLAIDRRSPFNERAEQLFAEIGGEQSRQVSFSSMALFPEKKATRLVEVRALDEQFPFYGKMETEPPEAAGTFWSGPGALVDPSLLQQFDAGPGDTIKIGHFEFTIAGALTQIPGETAGLSVIGPRVYIPLAYVDQTGLIQTGSRVRYRVYFKFDPRRDVEALIADLESELKANHLSTDTVAERREQLGRSIGNLYQFLNLVGFVALVLGGIGVASSIHLYLKERLGTVAVLRCVGATARQAFGIYLVQAAAMGLLGAVLGSGLGVLVQALLPLLFGNILPLEIELHISWSAILAGVGVGLAMALLFSLLPLTPIRMISPLLTLRSEFEGTQNLPRDPLRWLIFVLIGGSVLAFSLLQTSSLMVGGVFFLGLAAVFALLVGVARLLVYLLKKNFPSGWRYEWRQGLANLYRPHNQTLVMILAIGLGTFLIATLSMVQSSIMNKVSSLGGEGNPNLILFDIQSDQLEGVKRIIERSGAFVLQQAPIVTMRLQAVGTTEVNELRENPDSEISDWALRREFRSTYRDHLAETEEILRGKFQAVAGDHPINVSLEEGIAEELRVDVGDRLVFDVQGVPIETRVGSIRKVDWQQFKPNFFVVFPAGVLEQAPQFHVMVTRADSPRVSAALQSSIVGSFPNVSILDFSLLLKTVDSIIEKITFVIRFMALFSIFTGLIVLSAALVSGRFQRLRESVLLRTLGASRRQIQRIFLIEYFSLGSLSALTGLMLAAAASWGLIHFLYDSDFHPRLLFIPLTFLGVVGITLLVATFNNRGLLNRSPLEILRREQ